jgi:hypothetical protein
VNPAGALFGFALVALGLAAVWWELRRQGRP